MQIKSGDSVLFRPTSETERRSAYVLSADHAGISLRASPETTTLRQGQLVVITDAGGEYYCQVADVQDGRIDLDRLWSERREYFRVDDVFPVNVTKVDGEPGFMKAKVFHSYDPGTSEDESPDSDIHPLVWKMLCDINAKLGMILGRIQMDAEGFNKASDRMVNISATGIRCTVREEVAEGDTVELRLLLPTTPPTGIITYGRVVRVKDLGDGSSEVAVHFADMEEEVRDEIVHYALKRQRQIMRKRKQRESAT